MEQYTERKSPEHNYVLKTHAFASYTFKRCLTLPKKWEVLLLSRLTEAAFRIESAVNEAYGIYTNPEKLTRDELLRALQKRHVLLGEAISEFKVFDCYFSYLAEMADTTKSETARLTKIFRDIVQAEQKREPVLKEISVTVKNISPHELCYETVGGKKNFRLSFTVKQKNCWLRLEDEALTSVTNRLSEDRKTIRQLTKQVQQAS